MLSQAQTLDDHAYPVSVLAFSPDGQCLASGDTERQVQLRCADGGVKQWSFKSSSDKVRSTERMRSLAFSPDGQYLYVSARDAIESVYTYSGEEAWYYQPPRRFGFLIVSPLRVSVSADGYVACCFDNGTIGVWSKDGGQCRIWREPEAPAWIGWLQGSSRLAGADTFHVQVWDWQMGIQTSRWTPGEKIHNFTVHPSESVAAVRTLNEVQILDLANEVTIGRLAAPLSLPVQAFRPGRSEIAIGSYGAVQLFSYQGVELQRFDLEGRRATSVAWSADGSRLAAGCGDGSVRVFAVG
jgi:WD40 repeat protein